jgi:hypothetical protein
MHVQSYQRETITSPLYNVITRRVTTAATLILLVVGIYLKLYLTIVTHCIIRNCIALSEAVSL